MRLVEPCAGGAAISLHLMGASRALLPYQGSKWRLRREIVALLPNETLEALWLNDPGPWGPTWSWLYSAKAAVVHELETLTMLYPREVYDLLHGAPVPDLSNPRFAAEFLFLQRLSHSGKAVGVADGRWKSPGFNATSAYGVAATERFGEVKPMVPALVRLLKEARWIWPDQVSITWRRAQDLQLDGGGWTDVYFDPPYAGTTKYPTHHISRAEVVSLPRKWAASGARVLVSEGAALGPEAKCIRGAVEHGSPFRAGKQEWVTVVGADT